MTFPIKIDVDQETIAVMAIIALLVLGVCSLVFGLDNTLLGTLVGSIVILAGNKTQKENSANGYQHTESKLEPLD